MYPSFQAHSSVILRHQNNQKYNEAFNLNLPSPSFRILGPLWIHRFQFISNDNSIIQFNILLQFQWQLWTFRTNDQHEHCGSILTSYFALAWHWHWHSNIAVPSLKSNKGITLLKLKICFFDKIYTDAMNDQWGILIYHFAFFIECNVFWQYKSMIIQCKSLFTCYALRHSLTITFEPFPPPHLFYFSSLYLYLC